MSKDTNITHGRLKEFCDTIIMQAREVLYDREEDILKAWHENIEEAQQNDKKFPPLKLGIGATVDLESNTIETTLRFTAVYQSSLSAEIPDPNQPELPAVVAAVKKMRDHMAASGATVSIEVAGETVYDSATDDSDGPTIVDVKDKCPQYTDADALPAPKPAKGKRGKKPKTEGGEDDY